ncbi:MAG: hypothetical protein ACRBN8_33745 [Nannocystales bacterium]
MEFDNTEFIVCLGAGDVNADGNADVVFAQEQAAVVIALGDGDGGFGPNLVVDALAPSTCILRDFDLDGGLELGARFSNVSLWSLSATGGAVLAEPTFEGTASTQLFAAPDLNGDGTVDLIAGVRTFGGSDRVVPLISAPGLDELEASTWRPAGTELIALAVGDLNNDSYDDVAWLSAPEVGPDRIQAILGNESGKRQVFLDLLYEAPDGVELQDIALANVSGSEALDIVFIQGSELSILPGNGLVGFAAVEQVATIGTPHRLVSAEVDGTDTPEVAVLYSDVPQLSIVDTVDGGLSVENLALPSEGRVVESADANDDGVDDFLVASVDGPVYLVVSDL